MEENAAYSLFQPGVDSSASRRRTPNSEPLPRLPRLSRLPRLPELRVPRDVGGDGSDASDALPDPSLGPFARIVASAPSAACVYALSAALGLAEAASASISLVFWSSHSASAAGRASVWMYCSQETSASTPPAPSDALDADAEDRVDLPEEEIPGDFFSDSSWRDAEECVPVSRPLTTEVAASKVTGEACEWVPRPVVVRRRCSMARYTLTRCRLDGMRRSRSRSCSVRRKSR